MFTFILFAIFAALTFVTAAPLSKLPPRDGSNPKFVVAHHMVGNTYPYAVADWVKDITLASQSGIDAFALNIGSLEWEEARVADAYTAAQQSGTNFKLFLSFDMSELPCTGAADAGALLNYIKTYASHPNQFKYQGKTFASTFAGEACTFGQASYTQGWQVAFKQPAADAGTPVYFMPSFFVDPSSFGGNSAMDGAFNWNSAWPISLTTAAFGSGPLSGIADALLGAIGIDEQYINSLNGKSYMASASPWFFTHYGADTYNKNWIYLADESMYATRWEKLVQARDQVDIVEVITWNDYGESHYIGPVTGAQPNSQAWVDGMDHSGWLALTKYYATAYKTGTYPALSKDQVVMWARTSSKNSPASSDPVGPPTNHELVQDKLWAVVLLSAPGSVTLSVGGSSQTFNNLPAGASKLNIPLATGGEMHAVVTRNGATALDFSSKGYQFTDGPTQIYNYNAFVAASP